MLRPINNRVYGVHFLLLAIRDDRRATKIITDEPNKLSIVDGNTKRINAFSCASDSPEVFSSASMMLWFVVSCYFCTLFVASSCWYPQFFITCSSLWFSYEEKTNINLFNTVLHVCVYMSCRGGWRRCFYVPHTGTENWGTSANQLEHLEEYATIIWVIW